MPVNRYYSSTAQPTTLSGSISSGATSVSVGATVGFPSTTPFTLALDYGTATEELVDVTAVAGTTLTVTRGVDGTSAQSHSLGAAVRHVVSARDFAEFQTHQAATSAIHGVSGTLVGTSDTQTLSNKTLTTPTLSGGGSISGTWSGSPAFSGTPALQAGVTVSGGDELVTRAATGNAAYRTRVTGDSVDRLTVLADGTHQWSSGAAGADVAIARVANTRLQLTTGQWSTAAGTRSIDFAATSSELKFSTFVNGESVDRFQLQADGKLIWGGGAGSLDTNLYRLSGFNLATDSSLTVGGNLTVGGVGQTLWARKTSDTAVTSNTTLTPDPHLQIALAANKVYAIEGLLLVSSGSVTPDFNMAINGPAGAAGYWYVAGPTVTGPTPAAVSDADVVRMAATAISGGSRNFGILNTGTVYGLPVNGMVETSGTAGNLTVDWAQNTSNATSTNMKIYSWLRLTKVA